jgi:hypothetical protein
LDDPTAQQAAAAQTLAAAQAQVAAGYTVAFAPTAYTPGTLTGKFTVTNAADVAADTADRTISVISAAAAPVTTAAAELAKIDVPSVTIPVALTDTAAQQTAVTQAITAAQSQVAPNYTVSFAPSSYSPTASAPAAAPLIAAFAAEVNGILMGKFTVTNAADTAPDAADRTIIVYSTAAPSAATASSNAAAQFLSGGLLGASVPAALGGVTAHYENNVTQGANDTEHTGLDSTGAGQSMVTIGSDPIPLSDLLQFNMVNQYA